MEEYYKHFIGPGAMLGLLLYVWRMFATRVGALEKGHLVQSDQINDNETELKLQSQTIEHQKNAISQIGNLHSESVNRIDDTLTKMSETLNSINERLARIEK